MQRNIRYQISAEEDGRTIERFLQRRLYSRPDLAYLKREEAVTKNGIPARLIDRVQAGDALEVRVTESVSSPNVEPAPIPLSILYEDEDLVVVNKPAGMPTHSSKSNTHNSLASALAWYYAEQGRPFVFRCSNRLDRDTSGVIPVAKHAISGSILATMSERREISREYLAIVAGIPNPSEGTISAPLAKKDGPLLVRTIDWEHGESAVTHYRLLESKEGYSLLSIHLESGRTHQIRAHMQYAGTPLIGDYLYHPDMTRISRQALHSYRMTFAHPITREVMTFTAPLPDDMQKAFGL